MNAITPPARRKRGAAANPTEAVSSPELRDLIERLPLWRRPGYLVRRLHQIHHALFLEECVGFDITPVQYGLLTTLSLRPDADQSTLANEVGLDRTNVADVLSRLARRGLVSRRRGAVDQRTMVARLTPAGIKLTREMHAAMSRAQERFLSPLDEAERQRFVETLMRMIDANNHHGRAALGLPRTDEA
jgi:DNA-binding MarR family transcriptional regulator